MEPPARRKSLSGWNRVKVESITMLKWALIFLLISIVAGAFGYTGIAAGAAGIAKILFALFLILAVLFFILLFAGISVVG
jgi:uncharacterized membrane protein YtjA (UPF0391 family)